MSKDEKGVLQFFGRHLAALCVTFRYAVRPEELPQFRAYAGTLIALGGGVHFVTAGHVLSELHSGLRHDGIVIHSAALADTFGMGCHVYPFRSILRALRCFSSTMTKQERNDAVIESALQLSELFEILLWNEHLLRDIEFET